MIQNMPLPEPSTDGDGLLNIAHLFADLQPDRKRSEWEKRMSLWIASNGRCTECGGFLAAKTLVPVKSLGTPDHPFARVAAICPTCARNR